MAKELSNKSCETVVVIFHHDQKGIFILFTLYSKKLRQKSNLSFLYRNFWDNFTSIITLLSKNYINQKIAILGVE